MRSDDIGIGIGIGIHGSPRSDIRYGCWFVDEATNFPAIHRGRGERDGCRARKRREERAWKGEKARKGKRESGREARRSSRWKSRNEQQLPDLTVRSIRQGRIFRVLETLGAKLRELAEGAIRSSLTVEMARALDATLRRDQTRRDATRRHRARQKGTNTFRRFIPSQLYFIFPSFKIHSFREVESTRLLLGSGCQ